MKNAIPAFLLSLALCVGVSATCATACPFCSAVSMTLSEEVQQGDAAVIGELVEKAVAAADGSPVKSTFRILTVLKGEKLLGQQTELKVLYFGPQEVGAKFLLIGSDPKELYWGTPMHLSVRAVAYLEKVVSLPAVPADRLAFFQDYLQDDDPVLSNDAYNEFARAPYVDVVALKERMHRDLLLEWIKDDKTTISRRQLYLTMLSVCGQAEDVKMVEALIKNDDRQARQALNAMIGCYLMLQGDKGLPLIDEMFLKNPNAEYVDTYAAIVAIRVLGEETTFIPRQRLLESLRHVLDRPQMADLVIQDLARWEDWSAMDRLVELFKKTDEQTSWIRVPVVQYLRACPDPKAKEYVAELEKIDPDAVKRASYFPLMSRAGAQPSPSTPTAPAADVAPAPDAAQAEARLDSATPLPEPPSAATDPPALAKAAPAEPSAGSSAAKSTAPLSPSTSHTEAGRLKWIVLGAMVVVVALGAIALRAARAS